MKRRTGSFLAGRMSLCLSSVLRSRDVSHREIRRTETAGIVVVMKPGVSTAPVSLRHSSARPPVFYRGSVSGISRCRFGIRVGCGPFQCGDDVSFIRASPTA